MGTTRQWTLTLPWQRRLLIARRHDICRGLLGLFHATLTGWMRQKLDLPQGRTGSITVIQGFSSSLALDPRLVRVGALVLDGLYARDEPTGELRFHPLPHVTTKDVEQVVLLAAERMERWLARRGFGPDVVEQEESIDDAQKELQARSMSKYSVRRYQVLGGRRVDVPRVLPAILCYLCRLQPTRRTRCRKQGLHRKNGALHSTPTVGAYTPGT